MVPGYTYTGKKKKISPALPLAPKSEAKSKTSSKAVEVINQIERNISRKVGFDKYINRLRNCGAFDELISANVRVKSKITLLSYFIINNDYKNVSSILSGKNAASPLKQNEDSSFPLYIAIQCICDIPGYDAKIIEELLKYEPKKQAELKTRDGETALFLCVSYNRPDLVKKIASITPTSEFLIFAREKFGSPLLFAAEKGYGEVVQELLKYIPEQQVLNANYKKFLPLHMALKKGNFDIAKALLKYRSEEQLQVKTEDGFTVLHHAIQSGDNAAVQWLIDQYPDLLYSRSVYGMTPLFAACRFKNLALVKFFIEKVPDQLLIPDTLGFIPLSTACAEGEEEIAAELLKRDTLAQIKHKEPEGYNAILSACYYGKLNVLKILLRIIISSAPAKFSAEQKKSKETLDEYLQKYLLMKNNKGCTALHIAIRNPSDIKDYPLAIARELLEHVPHQQLIAQDELGRTPLFIAANQNSISVIELLLQYPNKQQFLACCTDGNFPLFAAAQNGNYGVVECLLKQFSVEQFTLSHDGCFPIYAASERGHIEVVEILEAKNPGQVLLQDKIGHTPLHISVYFKQHVVTKTLLRNYKVDRMARSIEGFIALHLACQEGNREAILELLSAQHEDQLRATTTAGLNIFHLSVAKNQEEVIKFVSTKYSEIAAELLRAKNKDGMTPLHLACFYGFANVAQVFLQQGADINTMSNQNWAAIHYASFKGHVEVLDLLISHGAEIDVVNDLKAMPLHLATERGHVKIIKKLLACGGIDIEARDKYQRTSLICAVIFNQYEAAKTLTSKKANVNVCYVEEGEGVTPLRLAVESYDLEMVKILINSGADPLRVIEEENDATVIDLVELWDDIGLKAIFIPALKAGIRKTKSVINSVVNTDQTQSITAISVAPKVSFSGRRYLKLLGFSNEELADFREEEKQRKAAFKQAELAAVAKTEIKQESVEYTWLNGAFTNKDKSLIPITNSSYPNMYCYLPKELLATQGCSLDDIEDLQFRFGDKHIKKLNDEKGIVTEKVYLLEEAEEIKYTHELKISRLDRILLFELLSDEKDACLFVGARYVESGFHVKVNTKSVQRSGMAKSTPLTIPWPGNIAEMKRESEKPTEKRATSLFEDKQSVIASSPTVFASAPGAGEEKVARIGTRKEEVKTDNPKSPAQREIKAEPKKKEGLKAAENSIGSSSVPFFFSKGNIIERLKEITPDICNAGFSWNCNVDTKKCWIVADDKNINQAKAIVAHLKQYNADGALEDIEYKTIFGKTTIIFKLLKNDILRKIPVFRNLSASIEATAASHPLVSALSPP